MTRNLSSDIVILGAGVVGLAIAERLVEEGYEVVLVDPNPPGSGTSFGPAAAIADYAVDPIGQPSLLRKLPRLVAGREPGVSVTPGTKLATLPWLWRLLGQSRSAPAERNAQALAALVAGAPARWLELAERLDAPDLFRLDGCLYIYDTLAALRAAQAEVAARRALGVEAETISPAELAEMEPGLGPVEGGAVWYPSAGFVTDPGMMLTLLSERVMKHAGLLKAAAERISMQFDGIVVEGPGFRLRARQVILAAGAWSRDLAATAGDRVPLETARGYHVEWDMEELPLLRPVSLTGLGMYLSPMDGRLRAAGMIEMGGRDTPPTPSRLDRLEAGAKAVFPWLGAPDRSWMGHRPVLPDSLPVIGYSATGPGVIHAFGHGTIGLTLAPLTAEIVADLVAGRPPALDLAPYRPDRF